MRPLLFRLPVVGWPVYSYGVMLALSLIAGWYLALGLAERDGLSRERLASCYVVTAIVAVIGARLLYVLTNLDRFDDLFDIVRLEQGGLVAYGGFLGGLVASWAYCRLYRIPLLAWADCAVPALASGLFLTRIGCFLYGCDYGRPTHVAWAVRFPGPWRLAPAGSPAYQLQLHQGLIAPGASHSLPVHPTQIYESLFGLALLVFLLALRRRRRFRGEILLGFGLAYGLGRFLLEFLRGDDQRGVLGPFSTSQWIGLLLVPICAVAYGILWRRARSAPGEAATATPGSVDAGAPTPRSPPRLASRSAGAGRGGGRRSR